MSDPVLAEKDPAVVLAEALAIYKAETGVVLAPADPRRLHLQAMLLLLAQQRQLIDFSGKQSMLRFVSATWIEELAALWDETPIAAKPSETVLRWTAAVPGVLTIAAGKRATDGKRIWAVVDTTTSAPSSAFVDARALCTVVGAASNGVAIGQIGQIVDLIPGIASVTNTLETISGRDVEQLEPFRERLRSIPESRSTCGPRGAYIAAALEASESVADAVALGIEDAPEMSTYDPPTLGEVHVLILEGERGADGSLVSVVPVPSSGLKDTVFTALSADDVRPLTDRVLLMAPQFVDFDANVTYYIARSRSRSAVDIQAAVALAFDAYLLWQQSKIGRDINPYQIVKFLCDAGAYVISAPGLTYVALKRDESAHLVYSSLTYGGVIDD